MVGSVPDLFSYSQESEPFNPFFLLQFYAFCVGFPSSNFAVILLKFHLGSCCHGSVYHIGKFVRGPSKGAS
jgi:hypothetical protein